MATRTALVTGANRGIGKEIARQLAAAGLTVFVGSRDADRGRRAVDDIDGDVRPVVIDVTDPLSVAAAARQVPVRDVLVNNAGIGDDLWATELDARAAASGGDPAEAAAGTVRLALLPDDGPTREFVSWDGSAVPW